MDRELTLADRIVAMHAGVVQQVGSPLELYDRPANLFVAGFIGSPAMNFLSARYEVKNGMAGARLPDGTLIVLPSPYQVEEGAAVTLGIRPEHVEMSPISEGGLGATVDLIEPTGFGIILHLGLHGLPFNVFTLDRDALAAGIIGFEDRLNTSPSTVDDGDSTALSSRRARRLSRAPRSAISA